MEAWPPPPIISSDSGEDDSDEVIVDDPRQNFLLPSSLSSFGLSAISDDPDSSIGHYRPGQTYSMGTPSPGLRRQILAADSQSLDSDRHYGQAHNQRLVTPRWPDLVSRGNGGIGQNIPPHSKNGHSFGAMNKQSNVQPGRDTVDFDSLPPPPESFCNVTSGVHGYSGVAGAVTSDMFDQQQQHQPQLQEQHPVQKFTKQEQSVPHHPYQQQQDYQHPHQYQTQAQYNPKQMPSHHLQQHPFSEPNFHPTSPASQPQQGRQQSRQNHHQQQPGEALSGRPLLNLAMLSPPQRRKPRSQTEASAETPPPPSSPFTGLSLRWHKDLKYKSSPNTEARDKGGGRGSIEGKASPKSRRSSRKGSLSRNTGKPDIVRTVSDQSGGKPSPAGLLSHTEADVGTPMILRTQSTSREGCPRITLTGPSIPDPASPDIIFAVDQGPEPFFERRSTSSDESHSSGRRTKRKTKKKLKKRISSAVDRQPGRSSPSGRPGYQPCNQLLLTHPQGSPFLQRRQDGSLDTGQRKPSPLLFYNPESLVCCDGGNGVCSPDGADNSQEMTSFRRYSYGEEAKHPILVSQHGLGSLQLQSKYHHQHQNKPKAQMPNARANNSIAQTGPSLLAETNIPPERTNMSAFNFNNNANEITKRESLPKNLQDLDISIRDEFEAIRKEYQKKGDPALAAITNKNVNRYKRSPNPSTKNSGYQSSSSSNNGESGVLTTGRASFRPVPSRSAGFLGFQNRHAQSGTGKVSNTARAPPEAFKEYSLDLDSPTSGKLNSDPDRKRRRNHVIFVLLVMLIVTVAVTFAVLAVTVGLSFAKELLPTKSRVQPSYAAVVGNLTLKILNRDFSPDLLQSDSQTFQSLASAYSRQLDLLFLRSNLSTVYSRSHVTGFREGSIYATSSVTFLDAGLIRSAKDMENIVQFADSVSDLDSMDDTLRLGEFIVCRACAEAKIEFVSLARKPRVLLHTIALPTDIDNLIVDDTTDTSGSNLDPYETHLDTNTLSPISTTTASSATTLLTTQPQSTPSTAAATTTIELPPSSSNSSNTTVSAAVVTSPTVSISSGQPKSTASDTTTTVEILSDTTANTTETYPGTGTAVAAVETTTTTTTASAITPTTSTTTTTAAASTATPDASPSPATEMQSSTSSLNTTATTSTAATKTATSTRKPLPTTTSIKGAEEAPAVFSSSDTPEPSPSTTTAMAEAQPTPTPTTAQGTSPTFIEAAATTLPAGEDDTMDDVPATSDTSVVGRVVLSPTVITVIDVDAHLSDDVIVTCEISNPHDWSSVIMTHTPMNQSNSDPQQATTIVILEPIDRYVTATEYSYRVQSTYDVTDTWIRLSATISDLECSDHGVIECTLVGRTLPRTASLGRLTVTSPPSPPVLQAPFDMVENREVTPSITCSTSDAGYPPWTLSLQALLPNTDTPIPIPALEQRTPLDQTCSFSVTLTLKGYLPVLTANGTILRCELLAPEPIDLHALIGPTDQPQASPGKPAYHLPEADETGERDALTDEQTLMVIRESICRDAARQEIRVRHPYVCHKYIACEDRQPTIMACPPDQCFDPVSGSCGISAVFLEPIHGALNEGLAGLACSVIHVSDWTHMRIRRHSWGALYDDVIEVTPDSQVTWHDESLRKRALTDFRSTALPLLAELYVWIYDLQCADENSYKCEVKRSGEDTVMAGGNFLTVHVRASAPALVVPTAVVESQAQKPMQITCEAILGRPRGALTLKRKFRHEKHFRSVTFSTTTMKETEACLVRQKGVFNIAASDIATYNGSRWVCQVIPSARALNRLNEVTVSDVQEFFVVPGDICAGHVHSFLPHPLQYCKHYLHCGQGTTSVRTCRPGLCFNPVTLWCDIPDHAPAPQCNTTGFLPSPHHCNMYTSCQDEQQASFVCPPGTVYSRDGHCTTDIHDSYCSRYIYGARS
ncbi:hypothetical protein PoB_000553500 [Plakobranchus ocellatus]|uniref:Chitin-binding type-2 domain-containing protein n=1 Tax=Plakobranchus ocellatus TaxID=259542 RepID=A0AAV3Y953_9GAST|nr:hypothetical protein PoB_000553500 [Plakobranchus ocellatus]